MKKGVIMFFLCLICCTQVSAGPVKIISREEWGADESYTDVESEHWKKIKADRIEAAKNTSSGVQQNSYAKSRAENKKRVDYVNENYGYRYWVSDTQTYNGDIKLAWPVKKSQKVDGIIIHHTSSEYESSGEGIRNIHKFHSLSRQWGDIGYNYIIGYDGEIYEGRLGGEYAVGAHVTWNNYSTMGIAIMGNYDERELTNVQYRSLEALISKLIYTYNIDMSSRIPLHKTCTDCEHGLITEEHKPIAGHQDGGHTSCPGENLYPHIETLNRYFKKDQEQLLYKLDKLASALENVETQRLARAQQKISQVNTKELSSKSIFILESLQDSIDGELLNRL